MAKIDTHIRKAINDLTFARNARNQRGETLFP
jgi:hypothetical protein